MIRFIGVVCALGLAAMANTCNPAGQSSGPVSEAERQQIDQRVQQYFKKAASLPPNLTLKVTDMEPSKLSGLLSANLEVSNGTNTQKVPFVVSRDGHFLIQGQVTDLTIDPFKATMDKISLQGKPIRGKANAPVTIVEYSDFECPFCGRAYKMLEDQALKEYGDKVRFVFKNFPLTNIHPWAAQAALASACAQQQSADAFWKIYDFLFQNQQSITPENLKEKLDAEAPAAGLDVAKFDACLDNRTAEGVVQADSQEGTEVGVRSTPTFFINGRKLEGAVPYENFKEAVDQALQAASASGGAPAAGGGSAAKGG